MNNKKRVLFLLGRYYPKPSPNSICVQNIINLLPNDRYDIEIICYDDGLDYSGNLPVTKVSRGLLFNALYKREHKQKGFFFKMLYFLRKIRDGFFIPVWPWTDPFFTNKVFRKAKKCTI